MTNQQTTKKNQHECPHCDGTFMSKEVLESHLDSVNWNPEPDNSSDIQKLPVNRSYNWNKKVPNSVPEYQESDSELTRIMADIENRHDSGQLPRYLISGPTGAGKTHLAEKIAEKRADPIFTIQGKYSLDESGLLGSPILVDEETVWTDGTLTKALLASQKREVVLLVDELNRARPESKGVLFSALDDRCRVELDSRGGEVIQGNPENLIVIGTINEGSEYSVQELDKAEKRRFGRKFEVQHLGRNHPEKEAEVISARTPLNEGLSRKLVETGNKIRDLSEDQSNMIDTGIPTSSLLDWARTAYAYNNAGLGNPVVQSARDSIVKPIFDRDTAREDVMETVKDYVDGAPVEKKAFDDWTDSEEPDGEPDSGPEKPESEEFKCPNCGKVCKSSRGVKLHQSKSDCYA